MIHPSYFELMDIVNKDVKDGEEPVVTSRYSIVLGTAKRARQLVAADKNEYRGQVEKPLSIAVDELKNGEIHIIRPEEAEEAAAGSAEDEFAKTEAEAYPEELLPEDEEEPSDGEADA